MLASRTDFSYSFHHILLQHLEDMSCFVTQPVWQGEVGIWGSGADIGGWRGGMGLPEVSGARVLRCVFVWRALLLYCIVCSVQVRLDCVPWSRRSTGGLPAWMPGVPWRKNCLHERIRNIANPKLPASSHNPHSFDQWLRKSPVPPYPALPPQPSLLEIISSQSCCISNNHLNTCIPARLHSCMKLDTCAPVYLSLSSLPTCPISETPLVCL